MNKLMFHADKVFNLIRRGACAPINLDLEITSRCTHRCYWCVYRGEGEIIFQRIDDILQRFVENGGESVTLSGGEPTMHKNFVDILVLIKRWLRNAGVLTNLDTETEKVLAMIEYCDWVRVSLDAPTAIQHEKIHGGGWDRIMENLTLFKERECILGLSFILDKIMYERYNYDHLEDFIASVFDNGTANYIQFKAKVDGKVDFGIPLDLYERVKALEVQFGRHRIHIDELDTKDIIVSHPKRCYFHHFVWQYDSRGRRCACCRREDIVFKDESRIPIMLSTVKCPSCRADEYNQFVEYAKEVNHVNFL